MKKRPQGGVRAYPASALIPYDKMVSDVEYGVVKRNSRRLNIRPDHQIVDLINNASEGHHCFDTEVDVHRAATVLFLAAYTDTSFKQIGELFCISGGRARQIAHRACFNLYPDERQVEADRRANLSGDNIYIQDSEELSNRVKNALERANIKTMRQLRALSEDEIINIKNLGAKAKEEILEFLNVPDRVNIV